MENPIKMIHRFNDKAGLLTGYDDLLEDSMVIEECLEGYDLSPLAEKLEVDNATPKEVSREIISSVLKSSNDMTDVERLDKACDKAIFAIGSMAKLGLNPQQITKALNVVMQANFAKLDMPKDAFGKLQKPKDFVGPELELQKILDQRQ